MASIALESVADTERMGSWIGSHLSLFGNPPLFLSGELGSGKTTIARSIVRALPGSQDAEIGSPSFTICNYYPCHPPVLHCDLYRCRSDIPDEILDALDSGDTQVLIEWSEYFPAEYLPRSFLDININLDKNTRLPVFNAHGTSAARMLDELLAFWQRGG